MQTSTTPMTIEEAEKARADWKVAVATRANGIIRATNEADKIERLASKIKAICLQSGSEAEAECLNTETVAAWLSDASPHVPATAELHSALMKALELQKPAAPSAKKDTRTNWQKQFNPKIKQDPVQVKLAEMCTRLELAWAEAFSDECKQFVEAGEGFSSGRHARAGRNSPHHTMPQHADGSYDSRFLPERTGDIHTTKNIHEYLLMLRGQFDFSHAEMGELLGISESTYGEWECGAVTPSRDSLLALKSKLNGGYEHLVNVLIDNRLATLRGVLREHTDSWGVESDRYKNIASNILSAMPHRYWQEVLDQAHNPHLHKTKEYQQKPDWAKHVVKVKTQGEYLAAVRHYLGFSSDELGAAMGVDSAPILKLEAGKTSLDSDTAKRCIAYFSEQQQHVLDGQIANGITETKRKPLFFRPEVLETLPQHHEQSEVHGVHVQRAANAVSQTRTGGK